MSTAKHDGKVRGFQFSPWNLLLIVPLLILVTPLYNVDGPRLFGMPFFYWFQLAFVVVGVLATLIVYWATRGKPTTAAPPDRMGVDDLDEGEAR
jgi:predicted ferric reductase